MKKIILALPLLLTTQVMANDTFGAMEVYSYAPYHSTSLTPKLRSGIQSQKNEIFASVGMGSTWAESTNHKMDYYQNQINIGGRFQVNNRLNVELKYQWLNSNNNGLDEVTYAFHEMFNLGQNGREDVEYGESTIDSPHGEYVDFDGANIAKNFSIYADYLLYVGGASSVSLGTTLYVGQSSDDMFEHDTFDQAVQLNYGFATTMVQFYSTVGLSFNKDPYLEKTQSSDEYRRTRFNVGFGGSYALAPAHRIILETTISQGALKESDTSDQFSEITFEATLGYRYLWRNMAFELAMIENYINMDNSADIGFSGGVRMQF